MKVKEKTLELRGRYNWFKNFFSRRKSFYYIPVCAKMTPELSEKLKDSELVLFDGTLENDEMASSKVGEKTGQRMGHMNNSGSDGSMEAFKDLNVKKFLFTLTQQTPYYYQTKMKEKLLRKIIGS